MQKNEIKEQEKKLQVLHKDLQDTSKDIIDKKQELTKVRGIFIYIFDHKKFFSFILTVILYLFCLIANS